MNDFPKQLKKLRNEMNLSQEKFGEMFHLSQQQIAHYELGRNEPNIDLLISFADFFGISVDNLVNNYKSTFPVHGLKNCELTESEYCLIKIFRLLPQDLYNDYLKTLNDLVKYF